MSLYVWLVMPLGQAGETQAAKSSKTLSIEFNETGNFNLSADNAQLNDVFQQLAQYANIRLATDGPLNEKISIRLSDQTLDEVLMHLLEQRNYIIWYKQNPSNQNRKSQVQLLQRQTASYDYTNSDQTDSTETQTGSLLTQQLSLVDVVEDLGDFNNRQSIKLLKKAIRSSRGEVKRTAIHSLNDIGTPAAVKVLALSMRDSDSSIREETIYALGDIGSPQAIAILRLALVDSDPALRRLAIMELAQIKSETSADSLIQAFPNLGPLDRLMVIHALGLIGGEAASQFLWEIKGSDNSVISMTAHNVLSNLNRF